MFANIAYAQSTHTAAAWAFAFKISNAIINPLILLMFAVAFIMFLWGCAQMIMNADSQEARDTGKRHIIYGVIGMVIMMGAWGILSIATSTFGVDIPQPRSSANFGH